MVSVGQYVSGSICQWINKYATNILCIYWHYIYQVVNWLMFLQRGKEQWVGSGQDVDFICHLYPLYPRWFRYHTVTPPPYPIGPRVNDVYAIWDNLTPPPPHTHAYTHHNLCIHTNKTTKWLRCISCTSQVSGRRNY
jgi:hypothetical protein